MKYISICSGIEAASVAWKPLGWEAVAFAEIEPFPNAVLAHHYPDVPNLGDITKVDWRKYHGTVDLVVGGTPCQSFSVAGRREGMDGASGLVREYFRLLAEVRPRWFVWENVPGVLSSGGGRDFPFILNTWKNIGYSTCWRVLDAQYFGVPQRRRRVFAVGYLGDWRPAAAVLFEPESLRGDPPPRRKAREEDSGRAEKRAGTASHWDGGPHPSLSQSNNTGSIGMSNQELFSQRGAGLVCFPTVTSKWAKGCGGPSGDECQNLVYCIAGNMADRETNMNGAGITEGKTYALNATDRHAVAFVQNQRGEVRDLHDVAGAIQAEPGMKQQTFACVSLNASGAGTNRPTGQCNELDFCLPTQNAVRRLTPLECERLQGFSDGWTDVIYRGKPAPDGARYKALGNSMAVPCMAWIGKRINEIETVMGGL